MAAATGGRVLGEIEETSLDEFLTAFRSSLNSTTSTGGAPDRPDALPIVSAGKKLKEFPIPELSSLVARHFRATQSIPLTVAGRPLPLVYLVIATLIAAPQRKAVVVLDFEGRFDIARVLRCVPYSEPPESVEGVGEPEAEPGATPEAETEVEEEAEAKADDPHDEKEGTVGVPPHRVTEDDLSHVHVFSPAKGKETLAIPIAAAVTAAEKYMLYGEHGSRDREWWGIVAIGGTGPISDVAMATTWKGWLRVDREELSPPGLAARTGEALTATEETRHAPSEAVSWVASSLWGGFSFRES